MTETGKRGIRISQKDRDRFEAMGAFESELRSRGYRMIAGVDEAGRGPLAGPVVAAACILPDQVPFYGLNDSKKMTPARREYLFDQIRQKAKAWSIAMAGPEEIDRTNILTATREAMRRALKELPSQPDMILIDAVALEDLDCPVLAEIQGDVRHNSIAAASVLAKVARDRMMESWDRVYPAYGFASHKGYGTRAHLEAIEAFGPCPIHRQSFYPVSRKRTATGPSSYQLGLSTERMIAQDLIARGHSILEHRFKVAGLGEIDFITRHRETLYVIECKGRGAATENFGGVEQALGTSQIRKIRLTARQWLDGRLEFEDLVVQFVYAAAKVDRDGRVISIDYLPFQA